MHHAIPRSRIKDVQPSPHEQIGPEGKTLVGYLPGACAPPLCSGFPQIAQSPVGRGLTRLEALPGRNAMMIHGQDDAGITDRSSTIRLGHSSASISDRTYTSPPLGFQEVQFRASEPGPSLLRQVPKHSSPVKGLSDLDNKLSLQSLVEQITTQTVSIRAEGYSIRLILDSREKPGLSVRKIEKMMSDGNVPWEARALSMGDAIWVARDNSTGLEAVLDCCLERKRLDDLLTSLKGGWGPPGCIGLFRCLLTMEDIVMVDGRYVEQKNRMKSSGLTRLVSYNSTSDLTYGMASCEREAQSFGAVLHCGRVRYEASVRDVRSVHQHDQISAPSRRVSLRAYIAVVGRSGKCFNTVLTVTMS